MVRSMIPRVEEEIDDFGLIERRAGYPGCGVGWASGTSWVAGRSMMKRAVSQAASKLTAMSSAGSSPVVSAHSLAGTPVAEARRTSDFLASSLLRVLGFASGKENTRDFRIECGYRGGNRYGFGLDRYGFNPLSIGRACDLRPGKHVPKIEVLFPSAIENALIYQVINGKQSPHD